MKNTLDGLAKCIFLTKTLIKTFYIAKYGKNPYIQYSDMTIIFAHEDIAW